MFNFFKRSKAQKSKQKHPDRTQRSQQSEGLIATKVAAFGACVANPLETPPSPPPMQLEQHAAEVIPFVAASGSGNGGEDESVKNKQHSPPTAASLISPNDIIHENGRSFGLEDDDGSVIEFADQDAEDTSGNEGEYDDDDDDDDVDAINEYEDLQQRGETSESSTEQSTSYNQNANLLEGAMAKGKNKRRYQGGKNFHHQQQHQQQQQQQQQQGQKQSSNGNHLLLQQACNGTEKINLVRVEEKVVATVTQQTENVTKVCESDSHADRSEHNFDGEQKVNIVSQNVGSSVLTAGDVNGKNAEDHEVENSIVVRSEAANNKPSSEIVAVVVVDDGSDAVGVSVTDEILTATTPLPVTSQFPLTQPTAADDGGHELLNGIDGSSSVPQSCPATEAELHSSAAFSAADSHEIKDAPRETTRSSETVTSEHVTSSNDEEMGQQPSKASETTVVNRRSSTPPSRPSSQQQPQPTLIIQQHLLTVPVPVQKEDASRDDISDDRDVFYETTESLSPTPASLDGPVQVSQAPPTAAAKELSPPLKAIIVSPNQSEARASPKKRVVFSEQLIIEGNPLQEFDLCNSIGSSSCSSANSSTESLPNALNLEAQNYEEKLAQNNDEQMHSASSPFTPDSLVNNNNHKNSVNIVLCVDNDQQSHHAFNSDNSGIFPSVPKPKLIEFKYDHQSDPPSGPCAEDSKRSSPSPAKDSKTVINEDDGPSVTDSEDTISLPDVVQPTSIDKTTKLQQPFNTVDKLNSEMKELVNQESRYSAKLEDAEKRASEAETKVYELRLRLDDVERDVTLKECNVDRLKAELDAACRECEGIRGRLRSQDADMDALRLKFSEQEDELNLKYQNLEIEYLELNEKLKEVRQLAHELNTQLLDARSEAETLRNEKEKLAEERIEEQKIIKEALELALKERSLVEAKWKNDFEQLRTVNSDREEHLMEDCEWKIRSMQKHCKEKIETVEKDRKLALDKVVRMEQEARKSQDEVKHLRSYESEVAQLRGLTYDQKEALTTMTRKVDQLKAELEMANNKLEEEIVKAQQIKNRCEYQMCEKEREALNRIEIARGEIAMQWEDRLLHEMNRLKVELEQTLIEERVSAINKIKKEALEETEALKQKFAMRERQLKEEIESLKKTVLKQKQAMEDAQTDADNKLMQSRMFVDRAEREHEAILARELNKKDDIIDNLKEQYEKEKHDMEQHFSLRIQQVQEEFARELSDTTELLKITHKKELEKQWKQLVNDKEEALQLMETRHRTRLDEAENKISFEEMRMRYERREPRQEDLQQIEELKSVIESQDHDLRLLTERLREMQLQEREQLQQLQQRAMKQQLQQQQQPPPQPPRRAKNRGKQSQNQQSNGDSHQEDQEPQSPTVQIQMAPGVAPVPIVCDIIYEENEADLIKEEQEGKEQIEEAAESVQQAEKLVVVDVPESVIQTETNEVHSTEPVIIESLPDDEVISPVVIPEESPVPHEVPIDAQVASTAVQATESVPEPPTIVVTGENGSTELETEVAICEVTMELPVSKPQPPAEPVPIVSSDTSENDNVLQQKVQNMPEMIVIRVPDVVAEAAAVEAAEGIMSRPRSSST